MSKDKSEIVIEVMKPFIGSDDKKIEKKTGWVVWVNTDLTEGRGPNIPLVACEIEATAIRIGKGKNVQGTNGSRIETDFYYIDNQWYGPITIKPPTPQDEVEQENIDAYREVLEKAESLGLSKEEISLLTKS